MLERQLSAIIANHLNKFLRNIPEDQLNVSLWAGEVVLENVALQEDIFDQLSLLLWRSSTEGNLKAAANAELASLLMPFTVVRGVIRRLRIALPWSALESEPVSVEIDGVDIVLGPLRQRPFDRDEEDRRQAAVKEVQLAAFDSSRAGRSAPPEKSSPHVGSKGAASTVTGLASSFVDRLVSTVVRNVQLTMRSVSISFTYDYTGLHPQLATSLRLVLEEVAVVPTDDAWRPRFIHTTSVPQCRLVHIGGISLSSLSQRDVATGEWGASVALVEPFDVRIGMTTPPENHPESAPILANMTATPIVANLSAESLKSVVDGIASFTRALEFAEHRPFLPLLADARLGSMARRRWRFALSSICHQQRVKQRSVRDSIRQFLAIKGPYLSLVKRSKGVSWLPPLTVAEQNECTAMEKVLAFDQIVFLRCLAKAELEEEGRHVGEDRLRLQRFTNRAQPPQQGRRWGMWWGRGSPPSPSSATAAAALPSYVPAGVCEEPLAGGYSTLEVRRRVAASLLAELRAVDRHSGRGLAAFVRKGSGVPPFGEDDGGRSGALISSGSELPSTAALPSPSAELPQKRPIAVSVEVPSIALQVDTSAMRIVGTITNIIASSTIGAPEALGHVHQIEVGSVVVAADGAPSPLLSIPQTSSSCFSLGADVNVTNVNAAVGRCLICVPPPQVLRHLVDGWAELQGAMSALHDSTQRTRSQGPIAMEAGTPDRPPLTARRSAMTARLSLRCIQAVVDVPEGHGGCLVGELGMLDVGCFLSDTGEPTIVVETVASAERDAFAGIRLFLTDKGLSPSGNVMGIEAVGLRVNALQDGGIDVAVGAVSGAWQRCSVLPLYSIVAGYTRVLSAVAPRGPPSACTGARELVRSPCVGVSEEGPSAPDIRVAVYSFEFNFVSEEGCAVSGCSREDADGGLSPWLYILQASSALEVRCEGLTIVPAAPSWAHAVSRIGWVYARIDRGTTAPMASAQLSGARLAFSPCWVSASEMVLGVLSAMPPATPAQEAAASPNVQEFVPLRVEITSPVTALIAAEGPGSVPVAELRVDSLLFLAESPCAMRADVGIGSLELSGFASLAEPVTARVGLTEGDALMVVGADCAAFIDGRPRCLLLEVPSSVRLSYSHAGLLRLLAYGQSAVAVRVSQVGAIVGVASDGSLLYSGVGDLVAPVRSSPVLLPSPFLPTVSVASISVSVTGVEEFSTHAATFAAESIRIVTRVSLLPVEGCAHVAPSLETSVEVGAVLLNGSSLVGNLSVASHLHARGPEVLPPVVVVGGGNSPSREHQVLFFSHGSSFTRVGVGSLPPIRLSHDEYISLVTALLSNLSHGTTTVSVPAPRQPSPSPNMESGSAATSAAAGFLLQVPHTLSLSVGACPLSTFAEAAGAVTVTVEGVALYQVAGVDATRMAARCGAVRLCDDTARRLLIPQMRVDDPRQSSSTSFLPPRMPIVTVSSVETSLDALRSGERTMSTVVDTVFVTCLYESLRIIKDTLVPDALSPLLSPAVGTAPSPQCTLPSGVEAPSSHVTLSVRNTSVFIYEAWLERLGTVMVPMATVDVRSGGALGAETTIRVPEGVGVSAESASGARVDIMRSGAGDVRAEARTDSVGSASASSPFTLVMIVSVPPLLVDQSGPHSHGSISITASHLHLTAHPAFLRLANAAMTQLIPLSELSETPSGRSGARLAPMRTVPVLSVTISNTVLEVVQCVGGHHAPLLLTVPMLTGSSVLVSHTANGKYRCYSDVLTLALEGVRMSPPIIDGVPERFSLTISRPLPLATVLEDSGAWIDLTDLLVSSKLTSPNGAMPPADLSPGPHHSRAVSEGGVASGAAVGGLSIPFEMVTHLHFSGTIRVCRSHLGVALRVAKLFGDVPSFPASLRPQRENYIPISSSIVSHWEKTTVELQDEESSDIVLVVALPPQQCEVTVGIETQECAVSIQGYLNVSDATGMGIVRGGNVGVSATAHPERGVSALVGGMTAVLDLKRANALMRVLSAVEPIMADLAAFTQRPGEDSREQQQQQRVVLSPDVLHGELSDKQRLLKASPPPLRIGMYELNVELAHIARVGISKASVTVEASGVTEILVEEVSMEDRRGDIRRIVSVSHVKVSSAVGDVRIKVHSACIHNDAIFFTDLGTAMLHAYRSILPRLKIQPKSEEEFKQSLTVDLSSCSVFFCTFSGSDIVDSVDVTFPGLVIKTTQTTEGLSLCIDAIDGSMGFTERLGARQALCHELRFRLEVSASGLEDATRLVLGKVSLSAPLGSSLRTIVTVMAENLTPYALWVKLLTRGAQQSSPNPASTRHRTVHFEVPSLTVALYEIIAVPSLGAGFVGQKGPAVTTVVSVSAREVTFHSHLSPDAERLELRVGSVTSSTDRTIQPDFIRALPSASVGDRDATSNYGIFLRLEKQYNLGGSQSSTIVRWGTASLVLSPQLIRLLDDNVLRPASMGIREATHRRESYVYNESFTSVSSHDNALLDGIMVITADHTFATDVIVGGPDGIRIHIARRDDTPNVIRLRGAAGATLHLHHSPTRPIIVDEGISVYCEGLGVTVGHAFTHILDYVYQGERSFFNVPPNALLVRPVVGRAPAGDGAGESSYGVLSAGLKNERQHATMWSVRGQVQFMLCNNKDSFAITSDLEAEYTVSKRSEFIIEEKGFFGMPTLAVHCNDGVISKRPITLITHLAHHGACEGRPPVTNVNVILDTTSIVMTMEHAKLFYDTVRTIGTLASRAGTLGTAIDGMTSTADSVSLSALQPVTVSMGASRSRLADEANAPQLNIVVNAPSFRVEIVDAAMRSLGWGGIEGLALQASGRRDMTSLALKASCAFRVVDLPYAQGGERVLLDVNPEVVAEVGALTAGGSKCEVAVAIPPMVVNIPLMKLLVASSYEFHAPARGPYTITNETDLSMRIDIGHECSFDIDEYGTAYASLDGPARVRLTLREYPTPIVLDLGHERSEFKLPFLLTSANTLVVTVQHAERHLRLSTGVRVISRLRGVSDPLLSLSWEDSFGFSKQLECPPDTCVVLPFAVGTRPLRFSPEMFPTTNLVPIEVLCGMARAASLSNLSAGGKRRMGSASTGFLQYKTQLDAARHVLVCLRSKGSISALCESPDVEFEVSPIGVLRNDSAFVIMIRTQANADGLWVEVTPGAYWSWFTDTPPSLAIRLATSEGGLESEFVTPFPTRVTDVTMRAVAADAHPAVLARLSPVSTLDATPGPACVQLSFSCGPTVFNMTPFSLELFVRNPANNKDVLAAGLCGARGIQPQQRHPLGYSAEGRHHVRLRPVLPNAAMSGQLSIGTSSLATMAGASCIQSDGPGGTDVVHIFSLSEKDGEIRVSPMWSVANATDRTLKIITGVVDIIVPPRGVGGLTSFPVKESADPSVCFSFEGYLPSAPLHLASASQRSTTNTHQCLLVPCSSTGNGKVACLSLGVDRRSKRHVTVSASISDTIFPYEVENRTDTELFVSQRGQTRRVRVAPRHSVPFAFDTLTGGPKVMVFETSHGVAKKTLAHAVDPDILPAAADGWELAKGLYMTAYVSALKCTFSLVSDRLLHALYVYKPRSITNISFFLSQARVVVSSPVGSTHRTVFAELADQGAFGLRAQEDPRLFLERREFDIVCLNLADVTATMTDNGRHRLVTFGVGDASVDDVTWEGARHPTLVTCRRGQGVGQSPWGRFSLHQSSADNATMDTQHIVSLMAKVGVVQVDLNDRVLHTLVAVGTFLADTNASVSAQARAKVPASVSATPADLDRPSRLKVDRVLISPLAFIISYARRSDGKYDPFAGLAIRHLVTSLESAPLTLSEVSALDYVVAVPEDGVAFKEMALQLFVPVYRSSVVLQSIKLIGSLEVLGNPMLFTSTVSEGVRDFINATVALNPLEGVSHLLTATGSGLLHTCSLFSKVGGRLVGKATFDSNWLAECDATNGRSVLRGIQQGATGVITRPISGARAGGIGGALTGLLTGATGAIAKPVSGALLTMASATEGAALALRRGNSKTSPAGAAEDGLVDAEPSLRNAATARAWAFGGEDETPTSTPINGDRSRDGARGEPLRYTADTYARLGPRGVALGASWGEFTQLASTDAFVTYGHLSRDRHLLSTQMGAARRPVGVVGAACSDAAAIERAHHLKGTLGVAGMLKYVTFDQFVKCVGWEEAKRAVPADEFRAKVAPLMLRELEAQIGAVAWLA